MKENHYEDYGDDAQKRVHGSAVVSVHTSPHAIACALLRPRRCRSWFLFSCLCLFSWRRREPQKGVRPCHRLWRSASPYVYAKGHPRVDPFFPIQTKRRVLFFLRLGNLLEKKRGVDKKPRCVGWSLFFCKPPTRPLGMRTAGFCQISFFFKCSARSGTKVRHRPTMATAAAQAKSHDHRPPRRLYASDRLVGHLVVYLDRHRPQQPHRNRW